MIGDCAATIAVQEALSPTHTRLIQSCKVRKVYYNT
jgi:hypothetical protein